MSELPTPISDQDKLLSNIAIGTPDIEDLIPNSRQEVYLKYIALNGTQGTYESPVSIENGGTGAKTSEEARQNLGINLPLPIENGGTGGTTETAARKNLNVYQMVVLYSNGIGTSGTVTLNDSVHNYQYIEIFYRSGNYYYDSVRIAFGSEMKYSNLSVVNPNNGNVYIDTRTICISGTSITNSNTGQCGIENGSSYSNTENHIAINRVMGYKF